MNYEQFIKINLLYTRKKTGQQMIQSEAKNQMA